MKDDVRLREVRGADIPHFFAHHLERHPFRDEEGANGAAFATRWERCFGTRSSRQERSSWAGRFFSSRDRAEIDDLVLVLT